MVTGDAVEYRHQKSSIRILVLTAELMTQWEVVVADRHVPDLPLKAKERSIDSKHARTKVVEMKLQMKYY